MNKLRLNCFRNYQSYTDVFANINFNFFAVEIQFVSTYTYIMNYVLFFFFINYPLYYTYVASDLKCLLRL